MSDQNATAQDRRGGVVVDDETVHAAGIAVHAIDAGRRVGWAKAFAAIDRADRAERELNIVRSDIDTFRDFAGQAFGALMEIAGPGPVQDLFSNLDCDEVRKSLPDGPFRTGRDKGRNLITRFEISLANNRAKLDEMQSKYADEKKTAKAQTAAARDEADKAYRTIKRQVIDEIVKEFGFADQQAFWDHLAPLRRWED